MNRRQMQSISELEATELELAALNVEDELRRARKTRSLVQRLLG